jgi:hypothetical protein
MVECDIVAARLVTEGRIMASKDKGGAKGSKTAASKTLKEKRAAKKAKGKGGSGSTDWSGSK